MKPSKAIPAWATKAAMEIIRDLEDRRLGFDDVDRATLAEIRQTIAEIMVSAAPAVSP